MAEALLSHTLVEYVYVDTALGALNRRNRVRAINDIDFRDAGAERYISHRRASVELVEWTRTHTNSQGNPTIEGFDGKVWDSSLPFDFDDRGDPARALGWVREFLDRLAREDVPLDALRYYFSGAKGFHVEIPHTLFGGFEPSEKLHVHEKAAAMELMGGIPFDTAVYDKLRLWRLTNTLNAKGHRYKVQLSYEEIRDRTMAEILELAGQPRPRLISAPDGEWMPNDYLVGVWQRASGVSVTQEPSSSGTPEVPTWSDERGNAVLNAATTAAIAMSWPHTDPTISRHSDYLLPLSGFLARQVGAEAAADMLKEAARLAGDRSFLDDRTRHWEDEIDRLAEGSAGKIGMGQPVEGLPTIAKRWPELADFLATHYITHTGAGTTPGTEKQKGFTLTLLESALDEPPERTAFLVDRMLPVGGVSLWGAKPKVGKSVMVRNLAMCISRGEPFLERLSQQGTVLVLALEEKRSEVIDHFRRMGGSDEQLHLHTGAAPSSSKEGLAALAILVAVYQPALVIVDPVFKLVRVKDSSDYAELTRELEPIIELARRTNVHIAVTHHLGKMMREGGDDVLGSTAIFGAVDTLVLMRRRKDNMRTLETIQRYGSDLAETAVPMDEASGTVSLGAAITELKLGEAKTKVLEVLDKFAVDYWTNSGQIRDEAGLARSVALQVLKELVDAGEIEVRGAGKRNDPFQYRKNRIFESGSSTARTARTESSRNGSVDPESCSDPFRTETPEGGNFEIKKSCSAVLPTSSARTEYRNEKEPLFEAVEEACKVCGKALDETEKEGGFGVCQTCV
jgi:hypothetical protein